MPKGPHYFGKMFRTRIFFLGNICRRKVNQNLHSIKRPLIFLWIHDQLQSYFQKHYGPNGIFWISPSGMKGLNIIWHNIYHSLLTFSIKCSLGIILIGELFSKDFIYEYEKKAQKQQLIFTWCSSDFLGDARIFQGYVYEFLGMQKPDKWLKPWQMGTHLIGLSKSFSMNTNMAGF